MGSREDGEVGPVDSMEVRAAKRAVLNARQRRCTRRRRAVVIWAYGGRCACCGERRLSLLTVDHMTGDGARHRAEVWLADDPERSRYSGQQLYRWLIASGFPPGFQVLCRTCNLFKGTSQRCPCSEMLSVEEEFPDLLSVPQLGLEVSGSFAGRRT